jgi:nitrogen regulatory protein PII
MAMSSRKLLTIITESALESKLCRDIEKLGAHGYTITNARGKGSRGKRNADWGSSANIRIEVVCEETTATAISDHLRKEYYQDYAMIVFLSDVAVLRPEKF